VIPFLEQRLRAIYLEDHFAGSMGGIEMARRLVGNNADTAWEGQLRKICAEIEDSRERLREVMETLGVRRNLPKVAGAWTMEKAGRLKLNGRIRGYSPLSRLVELEMLQIGITGQQGLWEALDVTSGQDLDAFDFKALAKRAEKLREEVKRLHLKAAEEAFEGEAGA
jgi:hypothetical protein